MMSPAVLAGPLSSLPPFLPVSPLPSLLVCSLCVVTATVWEWQEGGETQRERREEEAPEEADLHADQSGIFLHSILPSEQQVLHCFFGASSSIAAEELRHVLGCDLQSQCRPVLTV